MIGVKSENMSGNVFPLTRKGRGISGTSFPIVMIGVLLVILWNGVFQAEPAAAASVSFETVEVYEKIFDWIESCGYSISIPETGRSLAATEISKTENLNGGTVTETGTPDKPVASSDDRVDPADGMNLADSAEILPQPLAAGDWQGGYSIDSNVKVDIIALPGEAQLQREFRENELPEIEKRRVSLQNSAGEKGTTLNVPYYEEMPWACGEKWIEEPLITEGVFISGGIPWDFYFQGIQERTRTPLHVVGQPDASGLDQKMSFTFFHGPLLVSVEIGLVESGSGIFRDRVEASSGAVALFEGIYKTVTGRGFPVSEESPNPLSTTESSLARFPMDSPDKGVVLPAADEGSGDVPVPGLTGLPSRETSSDRKDEAAGVGDVTEDFSGVPDVSEGSLKSEGNFDEVLAVSEDAGTKVKGVAGISGDLVPDESFPASITGNRVNFRSEPTVSGEILGKLDKGERVEVLKEWTPPSMGEGILNEACDIEADGETLHLPNGFGVAITGLDEKAGTVTVSFLRRGEKVTGRLARESVSSTKGSKWYRVRRQDGTEGWAFGKYVDPEEGPPPGPGPDVQYIYYQALDLLGEEKGGEALFNLDQVLELYPGHVDALFERGRCLASMKRYEEALESFWEIPFYAPSHPLYLAWTGYCYQAMKQYDRALLAYAAVLKLHPDHDIVGPVSDHVLQCRKFLNLPEEAIPSEEDEKAFIFGRWDDFIAEEIWKGSIRGKGLWDTW